MQALKYFVLILLLSFAMHLKGQHNGIENIPSEELIVSLNKNFFIPGEEINVAVRSTSKTNSFQISRIAYLELVSPAGESVIKQKVPICNYFGETTIYLPSYLNSGNYTLLVYTKWMLNFGIDNVVQRQISLVNPFKELPSSLLRSKINSDSLYLELFPEGGRFYTNTDQNVAFKVSNNLGHVTPASVQIVDDSANLILDIDSKKGYGQFKMTVKNSMEYVVTIIDEKEKIYLSRLTMDNSIRHVADFRTNEESFEIFNLDDSSGHKLEVWHKSFKIQEKTIEASTYKFSKNNLSKGLLTFVIRNEIGNILYNKTVFNYPDKENINIILNQTVFSQRDSIILSINDQLPFNCSLVINKIQPISTGDNDIANYFMDNKLTNLPQKWPNNLLEDEILLMQDSKSHTIEKSTEIILPDFRGELIEGTLKSENGRPVTNHQFYISVLGKAYNLYSTQTDEQGHFRFSVAPEHSGDKLIFSDTKDFMVTLKTPFIGRYEFVENESLIINDEDLEEWLIPMSQQVQIKNLYMAQPISNHEVKSLFFDKNKEVYLLDEYTRFPTMEDHIVEYVSLIELKRENGKRDFYIRNLINRNGFANEVLITLNGVVCSIEEVLKYDPLNVEKIEVYPSQFQLGAKEFNGAVNFLTYEDKFISSGLFNNSSILEYQKIEEKVDNHEFERKKKAPDMRTQLAWEPNLTVNMSKTKLIYQASDVPGKYEVILRGVDGKGYVYERIEFEVTNANQ